MSASAAVAGAQPGGTDAAKRIEAAVDRTTQERSANVQMTIVIDADGESARVTAGGAIDFDGDRGVLLMDFSGAPPFQEGAKIEYRFIGGVMYADLAAFGDAANELPEGKHWVRINSRDLRNNLGISGHGSQQKATSELESLRGVSKEVEDLGIEDVHGFPATHYKATMDPKKAIKRLPRKARDKAAKNLLQQLGDRPLPLEVWIDGRGRAVRTQLESNLANRPKATAAGETGTVRRETVEYFEFGAPFFVYAPQKAETVDFADVVGRLNRGSVV
ncbi:MAG TPA: hypothetical protein VHY55_06015 [Acidimicrobiia bacterium]|nr:hypothetical protein [Acidimicrobiia bacterium]